MSINKKMESLSIQTDLFNSFTWKRLPIEHDYITIVFCLSKYKNIDTSSNFIENILNNNTKKAIQYIINIMPYKCIVDIENYENFKYHKDNIDDNSNVSEQLKKLKSQIKEENTNEITDLENRLKIINNKKTYIFTYPNKEKHEEELKNILDISINDNFNEMHKICIGEINNIPKDIISLADYILFEDINVLNEYLQSFNHNIRITNSNTSIYILYKCNYEYYKLFSFDKYISKN